MKHGMVANSIGEVVGYYWYREDKQTYCLNWLHVMTSGWTLGGIREWASKLDYHLVEDQRPECC